MEYTAIKYEVRGAQGRITLNRPQVRNAINHAMEIEVKDALVKANDDAKVKAIVITGAAPAFCSGIDLKLHRGRTSLEARAHFESFYWGFHTTHRSMAKPVIAVLNGPAREAGCTIAFMCDMIIAAEGATLGLPAVDRGIVPAYHLAYLPRVMGKVKAFEFCFSGELMTVEEAERNGIVNRVVPASQLEAAVDEAVARFATKSPTVMKVGKELFYRLMDMEMEKAVRTASDIVALMASFPHAHEGFGAYVEKREPEWKS